MVTVICIFTDEMDFDTYFKRRMRGICVDSCSQYFVVTCYCHRCHHLTEDKVDAPGCGVVIQLLRRTTSDWLSRLRSLILLNDFYLILSDFGKAVRALKFRRCSASWKVTSGLVEVGLMVALIHHLVHNYGYPKSCIKCFLAPAVKLASSVGLCLYVR